MTKRYYYIFFFIAFMGALASCKKFLQIGIPQNSVSTEAIFTDSSSASSGLLGIYSKMMGFSITPNFGCGAITLCAGQSADEFASFSASDQTFYLNTLNAQSSSYVSVLWTGGYNYIYQANLCIEGLANSTTLSTSVKNQFTAEAEFIRAFCYFYLTNLYGDIPYVTTSDGSESFGHGKMAQADIYQNIVKDLIFAEANLPDSFPSAGRIRPIKAAATALLARVYLYQKDWVNAEKSASAVINNPIFASGLTTLDNAFLKNNQEAIFQLQPIVPNYNTPEGYALLATTSPAVYLDSSFIAGFEPGDLRFTHWVDSVIYKGVKYYYPYKYKIRYGVGVAVTEYYDVLRLAEQFLIRAEARNHQNDVGGAVSDLNVIRHRAALPDLPNLTQDQCTAAVEQERRIELFSEWGHRWLDLKRTGRADAVLSMIKPKWTPDAILYPIPFADLQNDPSLTQNEGY
ncbi:MAG TPA: RagB/SusD family nutrient uptake outer membrane protein [Arachidicoccus sp.]